MRLNAREILCILDCMSRVYGPGYADGDVGRLQARLSIMLEVCQRLGDQVKPRIPLPRLTKETSR